MMRKFLTCPATNFKMKEKKKLKAWEVFSLTSNLGLSVSLPIVGGAFLGQFLDSKFNSLPKMTLSLIFLGLILAVANIYTTLGKIKEK